MVARRWVACSAVLRSLVSASSFNMVWRWVHVDSWIVVIGGVFSTVCNGASGFVGLAMRINEFGAEQTYLGLSPVASSE